MRKTFRPDPANASESGGALAIALLAVTAVTVLSMGFVQVSSSISNRQAAAVENKRAFYLAEAGLAESYMALKAGKSGQIGFDEWPAAMGSGAFWVDIQGLDRNRLRLDSYGLSGSGRATLSMVVEKESPEQISDGLFTDHNLTVPKGTLIDGFDSSQGTYEEHVDQGLSLEGARVGSNAAIVVGRTGKDGGAEIHGDAIPGVGSSVVVQSSSTVTGSVAPRTEDLELEAIEVPMIELQPKLSYSKDVPYVLPPGEVGYREIDVHGKGVLKITGPATLVTGELTARDDSEIIFDTTHGAVDLYVTNRLELHQRAALTTTSQRPSDVRIRFAGKNEVKLESEGHLIGTLHAPRATVEIGRHFQVFGALTALSLTLAENAQLHLDRALLGSGEGGEEERFDAVTWRVVEVPAPAQRSDPFRTLGVTRGDLPKPADAHDLTLVTLSVAYVNKSGSVLTYDGPEEAFDWKRVAKVISTRRALTSQHWEHDCSLHTSPRLAQNGYDGSTTSLRDILKEATSGVTGGTTSGTSGTSGSGKSTTDSGNSGSGSSNSGPGSSGSGSGSTTLR